MRGPNHAAMFGFDKLRQTLEQIRTIDKQRLKDIVCHLDREIMRKVDEALKVSFELHT